MSAAVYLLSEVFGAYVCPFSFCGDEHPRPTPPKP